MRANFCFKAGEVICPASPNYTFENGEIVFNAESRVTLQKEFNATIINHFITATKEISKGELVTVSPSLIVYDATKITCDAAVTGFKNIGEEEKQQLFAYVDEKIRQQALADGFIPRCQPECVEVVRKSNFDLVTIVPRGSKAHTTLFTIAAVPLPFPIQDTIEIPGDKYLRQPSCVAFIRHSCQPNVRLEINGTNISVITTRNIDQNEQLTRNFLCTEWYVPHPFHCACKTPSCYGWIRGFKHLTTEQQTLLLHSASAAVKARYEAKLPPTASLSGLQQSTVLTVTADGKIATQQYVSPGTVLLQVTRYDLRPSRVVIDSLSIAHRCNANTFVIEGKLIARRLLQPGEQLSLNLSALQYTLLYPFECTCGAINCTKDIRGFSGLTVEEQVNLLPFTLQSVFAEALAKGCPLKASSPLVKVSHHPIVGGVTLAKDFIPKGTHVVDLCGLVLPFPTSRTTFLGDDKHLLTNNDSQCLAHSCDPNLRVVVDRSTETGYCVALRDINPNDILSCNYLTTEWELACPFKCICGGANCIGVIKGFRHLDAKAQLRLWPHASRGVKSMFSRQRRGVLSSLDDSLLSVHETSGELRLMRDAESGIQLFEVTDVQVVGDEVALDDVRLKHCCSANAVLVDKTVLLRRMSLRDEALTININHLIYSTTPFKCSCKSENCTGEVRGFVGLSEDEKNTELMFTSSQVREAAILDGLCIRSTSPLVEVREDKRMGQSTFAKTNISKGTRFFGVSGLILPFATMHTIHLSDRKHLLFGDGAEFLTHSCDPNTRILTDSAAAKVECIALRDIKEGELISFNYLTTEWDMQYPFSCACGSPKCYGEIRGFKHLGNDARQKLWSVTSTAIKTFVAKSQDNPNSAWIEITSKRLMVCGEGTVHVTTEMVAGTVLITFATMEVLGGFVYVDGLRLNHHCAPTAALIENRVVLLRTVSAGEELNVNINCLRYSLPEEMTCTCCRFNQPHKVRGFKGLDEEDKQALIVIAQLDVCTAAIRSGFKGNCESPFIELRRCGVGLEVIAKVDIAEGTRLTSARGHSLPFPTPLTVQLGERRHLLFSNGAQFISHSCDPNVRIHVDTIKNAIEVEAIRNIPAGAVITTNFVTTEWELHSPFQCKCGSANCLHNIRGFKFLSSAQRSSIQQYVTPAMSRLAGLTASVLLPPTINVNEAMMLYVVSPVAREGVVLECSNIDIQPVQVALGQEGYIIQHKDEANTVLVEGRFVALRSIEPGEIITVNMNFFVYDMKVLFPQAYSDKCTGFRHLEEEIKQTNLYLCEPPVRAQAMRDGWIVHSTSSFIDIRQNGEMGQTAYANRTIYKGTVLFAVSGFVVPFPTMYTICVGENRHLLFGEGAECIAHHCDPNVQVVVNERRSSLKFVTLRDIEKGEMVTFNYCTTEWAMNTPFACLCGSRYCSGTIRGFSNLCKNDRQRLWPITSQIVRRYVAGEFR